MDQREVETMIKSLQKALAEKDAVTDVITIMEKLKKEVVPTEDLLRVRSLIPRRHLAVALRFFMATPGLLFVVAMTNPSSGNEGGHGCCEAESPLGQDCRKACVGDCHKVEEDGGGREGEEASKDGIITC